MPRTSLHTSSTKKAARKKKAMVRASAEGRYHAGSGIPIPRPSAWRIMVSKCSRAAVVRGVEVGDSRVRAVAVDTGRGEDEVFVARNIL